MDELKPKEAPAPRKSSMLKVNHAPLRKRSVTFVPKEVVIERKDEPEPEESARPDVPDGAAAEEANDKEVATLNDLSVQAEDDDDDEEEVPANPRPPTPPGVSHRKKTSST